MNAPTTWHPTLLANLRRIGGVAYDALTNWGQNGANVAAIRSTIDANLAATVPTSPVDYVLISMGTNDRGGATEATWKADYLYTLDAIHAKWPGAKVVLARPWARGYDAICATFHTWIDDIIAARSFAIAGPDEAVWKKAGDDGAAMTSDGIHYSTAGFSECARQWQTAMGY